jgi:hypothetical protein
MSVLNAIDTRIPAQKFVDLSVMSQEEGEDPTLYLERVVSQSCLFPALHQDQMIKSHMLHGLRPEFHASLDMSQLDEYLANQGMSSRSFLRPR